MQLSKDFSLAELTVSQTAVRRGIDNNPSPAVVDNLEALCANVLQPVRDHFGRPVVVSSGYRSKVLNLAIGGSLTSAHCNGEAADFTVPGVPLWDVAQWIWTNLEYDQLIYEFGSWIHVGYSPRMRNQELTAVKRSGKTVYLPGLVR